MNNPLLRIENLKKYFPVKGGVLNRKIAEVQAVDYIDFDVARSETLGIVGESGCGKTTTARLLMHLIQLDEGVIEFDGLPVGRRDGIPVREMRKRMQMVFQDSYSSLNPRLPVESSIAFGPMVHGLPETQARDRARDLLAKVGLDPNLFIRRYPHELSGGQRQRINVARALALEPEVLILDEAVSALDKSVEAQVLNLLGDLKREFNLTFVFISHDLNVVRYMSDRVLVMYLGKIVEIGDVEAIYLSPRHPYTRALLSAMPSMDPNRRTEVSPLTGDPPKSDQPAVRMSFPAALPVRRSRLRGTGAGTPGRQRRSEPVRRLPHGRPGVGPQQIRHGRPSGMNSTADDEPFPGYHYDPAARARAQRIQADARTAILDHGDGSLFDTEPQSIAVTLDRLALEAGS